MDERGVMEVEVEVEGCRVGSRGDDEMEVVGEMIPEGLRQYIR